jgi:adenylosuccinate synthase
MGAVVVVGAQWGDEGKGKIIDLLGRQADQVVRYSGGANAGHTVVVEGEKIILHLIPCGALHPQTDIVLGQGMVLNLDVLVEEIEKFESLGLFQPERFLVSERAHLVLPQHLLIDELRERGKGAIGTTKRGIGPAYEDKVARRGVRMGDLCSPKKFENKLRDNLAAWKPVIAGLGDKVPDAGPIIEHCLKLAEKVKPIIGDASQRVHDRISKGGRVLMEGAQGAMLDVDSGTYPFVTSSSTVAGSACTGGGIGPTDISTVIGVSKAYTTRVGSGPFPSEITGPEGDALREAGAEYGATTGRPRRCGWLDIAALRFSVRVNGISAIALTKLDVLTGQKTVKFCIGYQKNARRLESPPYDELDDLQPVYESMPGWSEPLDDCGSLDALPPAAQRYIKAIEEHLGCPVWIVGVGAGRECSIVVHNPFE